jgi:hypothetical protein
MKRFTVYLAEGFTFKLDQNGLPPEPGTVPLPRGMIRAYHFTDNLKSVLANGLRVDFARGNTYGEPNVIWFSTSKPRDFKDYIEVFLKPDEILMNGPGQYPTKSGGVKKTQAELDAEVAEYTHGDHDFYVKAKVITPNRFVTYHEEWHDHLRYVLKNYPPTSKESVKHGMDIFGDMDQWRPDTPEAKAAQAWKDIAKKHGFL